MIQKSLSTIIILSIFTLNSIAQTPCENGKAGDYSCENVDLLSVVTPIQLLAENTSGVWLNDIWGWTDSDTGKEYALVGMSNGTSFVDISDPINPIVLGMLPEHHSASGRISSRSNSLWRDVKAYKDHAFIVSEDANHGMQIFDLKRLRNVSNPPEIFTETAHYDGISKAHNIVINEATGFAYAVGVSGAATCSGGGLHVIDINDPINPVYAGCFDDDGYTHDAQCVIYAGTDTDYVGKEICFSANESTISISNVSDKNNTVSISNTTYTGVSYAHQGWLSEDHKYYYSNDETDELNKGTKTKTFVWDIEDLDNPVLISTFTNTTSAIDHNLYCKDTLMYQSNYTSGLRIINSKNVATTGLEEVAFFDSFYQSDGAIFDGSWSNYPFFESGNILISDITNGLFVVKYNPSQDNQSVTSLNNNSQNAISIYPNPAKGFFKLKFPQVPNTEISMQVFDFSGREVMKTAYNLNNNLEYSFDSSFLKKGLYHIRISYDNERVTKKLLVE